MSATKKQQTQHAQRLQNSANLFKDYTHGIDRMNYLFMQLQSSLVHFLKFHVHLVELHYVLHVVIVLEWELNLFEHELAVAVARMNCFEMPTVNLSSGHSERLGCEWLCLWLLRPNKRIQWCYAKVCVCIYRHRVCSRTQVVTHIARYCDTIVAITPARDFLSQPSALPTRCDGAFF